MNKNNYCVIMAGGIGSRFWPMSTTEYPKQFHDVLGIGKTLIQLTFDRLKGIAPAENIFIVTNDAYKSLIHEQLPEISPSQVLCEPNRRNTAPCIAYACYRIKKLNKEANIVVAPSDHLILKEEAFISTLELAIQQAKSKECLVTLGIKPSRPDTGYGYIQFNDPSTPIDDRIRKVKTFTEKPNIELAREFIKTGEFYWNSGIFIWNVQSILNAFEQFLPEINHLFKDGEDFYGTEQEIAYVEKIYPVCKNISIDFGIMEKAENVYVVLSDFGWSDLGTWGSLYTHLNKDQNKNAIIGNRVHMYDSDKCVVRFPKNKLVVLQGLTNYIVVEENNVLLVCKKEEEQKIKQFVNDIKLQKTPVN